MKLAAGATRPGMSVGDWRGVLVFDGSATVGDTELATGDVLLIEPDAKLPDLTAGPGDVHLLELARTAGALTR